jgi:hypothetical protein
MIRRKSMGESRNRCGRGLGRFAAMGLACACAALALHANAQSRSPAGDKSPVRGPAGAVVQYEESSGRAILYHEARGGLVLGNGSAAQRANGSHAPERGAASAKCRVAEPSSTHGATPLRAPQRKASPADGVAMRP